MALFEYFNFKSHFLKVSILKNLANEAAGEANG